jgi:hypothetical protein
MKKFLIMAIMCACISAYGAPSTTSGSKPPHRTNKTGKIWKTKKVRVHGYDRARTVKRVKYMKGYDYYRYANSKSYLRMMGRAINGNLQYR